MESMVKKYQQKFRKVKDEIERWDELQSRLISLFSNTISLLQSLHLIQESKNYGALKSVPGIENALLEKKLNSLQNTLLSMQKTMEEFSSIVNSLEKIVRDCRQQVKGGSTRLTVKQLQQRIGVKPSISDCLDGLDLLTEMHRSEYQLKLSVVLAVSALASKLVVSDDLSTLQQVLIDQPNIPREEVQFIFDVIFAEDVS